MKKRLRGVRMLALAAVVASVAAVPLAFAGSVTGSAGSAGNLWFVQFNGKPTADGGSQAGVDADKAAFKAEAKQAKIGYSERYSFGKLWNGVSIETAASANTLSSLSSVRALYPVGIESIPPGQAVSPELATSLAMIGADIAHDELGVTGDGVKVGIIDTGFDLDHPDLGGDGTPGGNGPNTRVVAQQDFVGDAYNADPSSASYNPTPTPDAYADDCNGHGTHVSGIVGASGAVTGVAPGVSFGAYRVFGCAGSANDDVILAALEQADADSMDIVNMSLGDAFNNWPEAPLAQASDVLVNHGTVVVASIGNSGADGLYSAGAPGVGNKTIGVAAFDNTHLNVGSFTVSPDGAHFGYIASVGSTATPPVSGTFNLARTGTTSTTNDACVAPLPDLTGKVVLIRRGTCGFYVKAINAQNAGAAGVILYNNQAGLVTPNVAGSPQVTIPVVFITAADGATIDGRIAAGPTTMTWTADVVSLPLATGGLISSFSSYGLDAELGLKPDIGAPGGFIRSTYPIELGSYVNISGTSMASPHVAGAAALLLEAKPNTSSQSVRSILQNSADPALWRGNPGLGFLDNVHRQGAGMLDIDDAILATTKIEPGKLSLGESEAGPATRTLTLTNATGSAVTYDLSHTPALSTGPNTFVVDFLDDFASAAFSSGGVPVSSVAVPAGAQATVDVTITAPAGLADNGLYGGYLVFTPQGGGQMYRVPYAGFKGDYQSIQVLTPAGAGYPLLGKLVACNAPAILRGSECFPPFQTPPLPPGTFDPAGPGEEYTLVPGLLETPFVLAHLNHQARRMRVDLIRVSDGKNIGQAMNLQNLPRNRTATLFSAFPWDGMVTKGNSTSPAPDDVYYFKLTLTKALGDASTAETWTSPNFEIDRP